jgi:hypothetical protein
LFWTAQKRGFRSFVDTRANGQVAPIPAVGWNAVEPPGSTFSGPSTRHRFGFGSVAAAGGIGRSVAASGSDLFLRQPRPAKAFRISGYIFRAAKRDEFRNVGDA